MRKREKQPDIKVRRDICRPIGVGLRRADLAARYLPWLQGDFYADRRPIMAPVDEDLKGIRVVNLAAAGDPPLSAFFRSPANGRLIILVHGTGADRSQLLPEARMLARHGFGVLSLDWPGHGESGGTIQWDEPERKALTRAIDWGNAGAWCQAPSNRTAWIFDGFMDRPPSRVGRRACLWTRLDGRLCRRERPARPTRRALGSVELRPNLGDRPFAWHALLGKAF